MDFFAVAVTGLLVGSFTNVLIARVPEGQEWVRTPSACPVCNARIAWYDNIPVVAWLFWLRRTCRHCQAPISPRYPLVEILVTLAFLAVYATWGFTVLAGVMAYMAVVSVALIFIDIDVHRLPDALVLPSFAVVAVGVTIHAFLVGETGALLAAVLGMVGMILFYGIPWLIYPQGLGFGDVKTAGLLGLIGGYLGWSSLAVGMVLGPLLAGVFVIIGFATKRVQRSSRVPYGPPLILGAWVGYLYGNVVSDKYLTFFL